MCAVVASRRNEAAGWLWKTVGVVGGIEMPAEPSEEAFRIALRSGIILCNALNKIQPGAVPKVYVFVCLRIVSLLLVIISLIWACIDRYDR